MDLLNGAEAGDLVLEEKQKLNSLLVAIKFHCQIDVMFCINADSFIHK